MEWTQIKASFIQSGASRFPGNGRFSGNIWKTIETNRMRITHLFAVSILAILLAACNKEAGVSAESAQSTGFKGEFSRSDSKSESAAKTNKVVAKQQLLTQIVVSAQAEHP